MQRRSIQDSQFPNKYDPRSARSTHESTQPPTTYTPQTLKTLNYLRQSRCPHQNSLKPQTVPKMHVLSSISEPKAVLNKWPKPANLGGMIPPKPQAAVHRRNHTYIYRHKKHTFACIKHMCTCICIHIGVWLLAVRVHVLLLARHVSDMAGTVCFRVNQDPWRGLFKPGFPSPRLHRFSKGAMTDPNTAEVTDEFRRELQLAQHRMLEQRRLSNADLYVPATFVVRAEKQKRTTVHSSQLHGYTAGGGPGPACRAASAARPEGTILSLFQPLPVATEASFSITAAHAGVDINDGSALQAWMQAPVTTRQDVLQTLRNYHVAAIRPEVYHSQKHHRQARPQNVEDPGQHELAGIREQSCPKARGRAHRGAYQASIQRWSQATHDQINWMHNATDSYHLYYLSALTRVHRQLERESGAQSPQSWLGAGISGSPSWPCMVVARVHRFGRMTGSKDSTFVALLPLHSSRQSSSCQ